MTQDDGWRELYRISLTIDDPRGDHGRLHNLAELLFMAVVALLAGAQNAEDIAYIGRTHLAWFRRFLVLEHGVPSHDTFLRALGLVKAAEVERVVRAWTAALRTPGAVTAAGGHVAFDGQALRGSVDRGAGSTAVQMVSAYLTAEGVVLGSQRVDDKSNEIKAIPDLVRSLNLRGAIVTVDAIGCQTAIAATIREAGADYLLQVKGNQPNLQEDVEASFAELTRRRRPGEAPAVVERHREIDKEHGRIETRVTILSRDLSGIRGKDDWRDLAAIGAVLREREDAISGTKSKEVSYFITSRGTLTAAGMAKVVRGHWRIENGLHWSLDVVWGSDAHKVRDRVAAENFARIRRFCVGICKRSVGWGMSARRLRMGCGWDPNLALRVLAGEVIERPRTRRVVRKPGWKKPDAKAKPQPTT